MDDFTLWDRVLDFVGALSAGEIAWLASFLGLLEIADRAVPERWAPAVIKLRHRSVFLWLALVFFLVASFEAFDTVNVKLHRMEYSQTVSSGLAILLDEGNALMERCKDETKPPPRHDIDAWEERVVVFLNVNLNAKRASAYVSRFRNASGVPFTSVPVGSSEHGEAWRELYARTYRVDEFMKEMTAQPSSNRTE